MNTRKCSNCVTFSFVFFFVENEENVSINLRFYNSGNFKLELNDGF